MLHLLSTTPLDPAILARTTAGDTLLLLEDAVIEALAAGPSQQHWQDRLAQQKIFVLAADLAIRGLQPESIVNGITIIDYPEFVQLTIDNEVIYSWH